ncbi:Syntaxin-binding protein 5 [Trachymyrmex cornetzi]|uniref:Syntaxin-binding protein 5-like n=1 Tax=Trachymyrmex cornetzi TaxID=471704 RepID=A0A195DYT4_9HYME|nr:Syntaxin-binding protein 5 [Trachymyrmex cornetzi]
MKKFTIKGVLDGFRSSVPQPTKPDQEIIENLKPEHFQVKKTFRHGFPHQPTALAFDPVQRLLAIGTKSGSLRILGRPGVDAHVKHEECSPVLRLQFLINEGALVSATEDDTLHLWNFRQKIPQVVHSLKFQRDRITCIHLPLQSKWLYIGTDRGNIHILHIETFVLSGYVINWNKAIEVSRKTHPGAVVHLSDNPLDLSKMLIGYSSGQIVLWDLKTKIADYRCQTDDLLTSITWHHEGKQFMCSHSDGSLSTWTIRQLKPSITFPHAKFTKDGEPERCKAIQKVEWKLSRAGEAYVIFSGGLAQDTTGRTPSITVIHGKTTTVLEMEHNVVDFITLCDSPWASDFQDPYAVVVLLQNDLVVIDLLTTGFPCFENPYPMDIHESPVTCCAYFADCPSDLVPAFYSVGSKSQKKTGFSEKEWPISGGEWSSSSSSYNEIILTGHADGSIKFWDASAGTLQVLYKLKTAKLFEKTRTRSIDSEEDPLAIQLIFLCPESRKLAIAGSGKHVVLFKFKKVESMSEVVTLEICLSVDPLKEADNSPDRESPATGNTVGNVETKTIEFNHPLKVKTGLQKRPAGFQATLICLTTAPPGELPENITSLSLNSSYGLLAYGNESGLVIVDIVQKISLVVLNTSDLGGGDPYQRVLRSPKRQDELKRENEDKARSPSSDQSQRESVMESEPVVTRIADSIQQVQQQQQCPRNESQTGNSSDKLNAEETTNESNKAGNIPNGDECQKSQGWKGFSLKRQLSKVDLKIKNTFTPSSVSSQNGVLSSSSGLMQVPQCQQISSDTGSQKSSTFYCNINEVASTSCSLSPVESIDSESSLSPESQSPGRESPQTDDKKQEIQEARSPTENENEKTIISNDNIGAKTEAVRPMNLSLPEHETKPPRLRYIAKIKQAKREGRLLSVPNLKFSKNETTVCDLRCEESATSESFTGNLIRRFNQKVPMNGMCVLPVTGRSTVGVGGERGDNGDNSDGCSTGGSGSNGAYNSDGGGGSSAGVNITRSGTRSAAAGAISGTDEEINTMSRKGVTLDQRHPRTQGIRKLQKCLSTTTSHFEVDSATGAAAAFPTVSLFYAQRSTEMRSYPSAVAQTSLNYQNILTNTRQYSSFGSITDTAHCNFIYVYKFDGSFQRSRSSSMSSLENITTETISCLTFADSYTKKTDTNGMPTLWIGTSLGSVQTVVFNTPAHSERHAHPVVVSTCNGSTFKLKGCILSMSFLDCNGALIPYSYESWKDENTDGKERNIWIFVKESQGKCTNSRMSPSTNTQVGGDNFEDRQFVVLVSEKQARVVALPSQNCVYRQQLAETHIVIKAEVTPLKDNVCLVCYVSNGHITTYSLPSLRPLIDVDFLPLVDLSAHFSPVSKISNSFQTTKHGIVDPMLTIWGHQLFVNGDTDQIAKTLCFSNRGHGLYLSSPMEIQKFSVSSEFCAELTEMMGDLFIGHDMPEPPKESFFKGLFGGGSRSLDREELFGESSGRASRTVAKHIPGPNEALRERVSSATGEVNMAHQMVLERGEKLSQLEERTARMMSEAENFSTSAHGLMLKYKDKKWYQL